MSLKDFRAKAVGILFVFPKLNKVNTHFGWVRVRGTIDGYEIKNYNLQSMGNENLFLPLKSEIRKKIIKDVGDSVYITLYEDNNPTEIPEELMICLFVY